MKEEKTCGTCIYYGYQKKQKGNLEECEVYSKIISVEEKKCSNWKER